ncbi:MAG: alpha-ketoglutarate-dependent dioxygenase AlkB [Pseudomonadota bacterium]
MRDLFETSEASRIDLPDADLLLWPAFASEAEADAWRGALLEEVAWAEERLTMFGREVLSPRLVAWYGDAGAEYTYSGVTHRPHAWTGTLWAIRERVERVAGARFNSVLANLYRHGRDSMGWHSDDEKELGERPVIASVSLGAERRFRLRHRRTKQTHGMDLPHGSLLVMAGETQRCWQHALPKTRRDVGVRVNLTFRMVA